jgi:polysaccharide deacetylase family protein (PEP-CTERM system associated)
MAADEYAAAFTIDVEDWYHGIELPQSRWTGMERRISRGLEPLLQLLAKHHTRGTFFTLGWVAEHHPDVVRRIAGDGHELASHGYSHEKVYRLTPEQFRSEVRRTKELLESISGQRVVAHRSPFFSITRESLWALEILKDEGYECDCSISPVQTWRYGIQGSPERAFRIAELDIVEFPTSVLDVLSRKLNLGGAYFRILPLALTESALERLLARQAQAIFYAHPWEYDPEHPVVRDLEWRARLTHYFNLKSTYGKTDRLLGRYRFQTLTEALSKLRAHQAIPNLSIEVLRN